MEFRRELNSVKNRIVTLNKLKISVSTSRNSNYAPYKRTIYTIEMKSPPSKTFMFSKIYVILVI